MTIEAAASATPHRTGKPREAQGLLNAWLFHPAARRLATLLARTPVTPNMVSVAGAAMIATAGVLYALVATPVAIVVGFAIHLGWHVVDGADGDLARMTGRASPIGEVVDGLCDYGGHIVLYLLLGGALFPVLGWAAWGLVVAAGLSRVVQSIYAESQRRTYLWWAYRIPWLRTGGGTAGGAAGRFYVWLSRGLSAGTDALDVVVAAADAPTRASIAALAKQEGRRTLPLQVFLGANARTVLLGLAMLAGSAAWFFLIEASVLNALLVMSIVQQRGASRRIAARLAELSSERAGWLHAIDKGGL